MDIGTDVTSVPTAALAATIVTRLIAANGTHGNSTSTTSRVVVDGNPGYTTLISGPGFGGAQVHLETVACWKDQTTVTVTVGNGPVGAAMVLAKLVASKIF